MDRRHLVAGMIKDVARLEFDRLEVRREQFEIRTAELLEKIVLGPTGHMSCSGRESAPARTLRFRDGADGSKVHTRRFSAVEKWPPACGIPESFGEAWDEAMAQPNPAAFNIASSVQECTQQGRGSSVARSSRSAAARALCPTDRRPIPQRRRAGGPEGGRDVHHPKFVTRSVLRNRARAGLFPRGRDRHRSPCWRASVAGARRS
ncbi:hypothetical protein ACVIQY_000337 [Bradyrhizobium sp. USDA 3051]